MDRTFFQAIDPPACEIFLEALPARKNRRIEPRRDLAGPVDPNDRYLLCAAGCDNAVALGMAGVLIVLSPRLTAFSEGQIGGEEALGAIVVLVGAVFAALAQVFVRKLVNEEKTSAIVFYFSVNSALLSLVTLPFGWTVPDPQSAAMLVCAGLLGGVGQIFLTSSYRHADASVVAPFDYASMLLAIAIGYVVFDEVPTWTVIGGATLVVFAGILIIWRERRLGLERSRQRKAMTPQG